VGIGQITHRCTAARPVRNDWSEQTPLVSRSGKQLLSWRLPGNGVAWLVRVISHSLSHKGLTKTTDQVSTIARQAAVAVAAANRAGDVDSVYANSQQDVELGRAVWNAQSGTWTKTWGARSRTTSRGCGLTSPAELIKILITMALPEQSADPPPICEPQVS